LITSREANSLANNMSLSHEQDESSDLTRLEIPHSDSQLDSPVFHTAVEKQPKMIAQLDGSDETPDDLSQSPQSPVKADD